MGLIFFFSLVRENINIMMNAAARSNHAAAF